MNEVITQGIGVTVDSDPGIRSLRALNQEMERTIGIGRRLGANDNGPGGLDRLSRGADSVTSAFGGTSRQGGILNGIMGQLGSTMRSIAFGATAAGALSVATAFTAATTAAVQYQDVMAKISTNVDTTVFDMKGLSAGIMEQARAFGSMPTKEAEAAYDIISAGSETASQALEILTSSNKLAVGGMTSIGVAADGLTSVLNSYAGKGLTAAAASDAMFISARDGKTTIEQLSSEVGKVAPLAATMGVSFDEVTGSLAALTKGGISTSESVTGVRAILSSISKPSEEAKKAAKSLGLEWDVNALQAKGLRGVLQDMADKTGHSTSKMAVLLGGVEALVPALALTANSGREFATTMDHMAEKAGSTDLAVKKMMDGSPSVQWNRMLASANAELIKLGTTVATNAIPAMKFLGDNMGTISTILELSLIPLGLRMASIWGAVMLESVVSFTATAAMRFASLATAQGVLAASTATLSAGFSGMLSLVGGPLVVGIAAAAYGIYTLASNSRDANAQIGSLAAAASKTAAEANNTHVQTLLAARGVNTFGGQAGKAAEQLWQMARAAKAAAVESARLQLVKSVGTFRQVQGLTDRGFANAQARDNSILTSGDASLGDRVSAGTRSIQRGWNKIWAPNQKTVTAARDEAFRQAQAARKTLTDALSSREESYLPTPQPRDTAFGDLNGGKKKGAGGKTDAEKLADKLAEFWKKVDGDSKDAVATYDALKKAAGEGVNLSIASADTAKQLELQRLVGRNITDDEKARIVNALGQQRTSKFLSDELVAAEQRKLTLQQDGLVLGLRQKGMTDAQISVERGVIKFRADAQAQGVDLSNAAYAAAENKLRTDLASARAIEDQNKALDDQKDKLKALVTQGKQVVEQYSARAGMNGSLAELADKRKAADAFYQDSQNKYGATGTRLLGIDREYQEAIRNIDRAGLEVTNQFKLRWVDAIGQIADNFTGRIGAALNGVFRALEGMRNQGTDRDGSLLGGVASLFGGKVKDAYKDQAATNANSLSNALGNPLKSLDGGFKDFKAMFTNPGEGGFAAVLGKGLAKAGMGAEFGSATDSVLKAVGIKSSKTGAQIGGAIGGVVGGPIGGFIGGALGGVIGGLFKKDKQASAGFSVVDGQAMAGSATGFGKAAKAEAAALAGSVAEGINSIATALGATVGSLDGVSVGYRPGHKAGAYRVDTSGQGKLTGVMAFETEAEAVAFAIKTAISKGALTGLSDLIGKAVKTMSSDAAISFANDWKKLNDDLLSMTNPIQAAVKAITAPLDNMRATMLKLGASSTDLSTLEDYRNKKLTAVYKEQVSGFQSVLDSIKGSTGGVSDYGQLKTKLSQFAAFQADVQSGKQVDQNALTSLSNDILGLNGNVNGFGTKASRDVIGMVETTVTAAMANMSTAFTAAGGNADIVAATAAQTAAQQANSAQTNAILNNQLTEQARTNALLEKLVAQGIANDNSIAVRNASANTSF